MRSKLPILLVILSVSLNLAFVGAWLINVIPSWHSSAHEPGVGQTESTIWCPLHRAIGIDLRQWEKIEPHLTRFHAQTAEMRQEIGTLRQQMLALLAAPQAEARLIQDKQEEILRAQRAMQALVIQHLLGEKELLTAAQQQKFFALIGKQMYGGEPLPGSREQGCLP